MTKEVKTPIATLNHKRGLIRIWIVLSVIWAAFSLFAHLDDFARVGGLLWKSESTILNELAYRGRVDEELIRSRSYQVHHDHFTPEQMSKMITDLGDQGRRVAALTSEMVVKAWANRTAGSIFFPSLSLFLLKAAVPPTLLFLLGWAALWVIRGFRDF
ncbi:hypothetical protein P5P81_20765 [Tritonibacter mobilis]|nr:hypothetical protein [Tritonibacter mobilis]